MRSILHIDFNSYFATVEQQANPRLRGKPIGVTGGDRMPASPDERASRGGKRTVLGAASIEAKKFGVKTGMQIWQAKKLCPSIVLVQGDSDKYLEVTKRFLAIINTYSPYVEVFSIDEVFIEVKSKKEKVKNMALEIKQRIRAEIGEWMKVSIGISYNKLMAKVASNLQKPDGLILIPNQEEAIKILDKIELDEICGIGFRIKRRLNNMGIFSFASLRKIPLEPLLASFKSYGQILYNMSRGIDESPVVPFYEKGEVKSVGHRHTIDHDTGDVEEIKQILLKLTEMVARRLRAKKLVGRTVSLWFRYAFTPKSLGWKLFNTGGYLASNPGFAGDGMQVTIPYTCDGLEIFKTSWKIFHQIWSGGSRIRMVGVSISNLRPQNPQNLSLLPETSTRETMLRVIDVVNDKFGEFTLQRGTLLGSAKMKRKANPFLADRRFKL